MLSPSHTPEYESSIQQQEFLKKELMDCLNEYDYLIYHRKPILESEYFNKIGRFRLEILQVQTEMLVLKRKTEMMQKAINRNEGFDKGIIDLLVEAELKEHLAKLEQETKLVEEAISRKSQLLKPDEGKRLRELYYGLARKLHPDVNPTQSESTKALWLRVHEAYKNGDLSSLEALAIVSEQSSCQDQNNSLIEEIQKRNEQYSKHIAKLLADIQNLKTFFPFTIESQLEDKVWIKTQMEIIERELKSATENKLYYETLYNKLSNASE